MIGYWDQGGRLTIYSLSEPKEDVHIGVGASTLEVKGLERKGNYSVSRIFKGGFIRRGRKRWENVHSAVEEAVETQERSAESRVLMRDAMQGTMISQMQKARRI